ncbi:hypothetical protein ISS07_01905 [Candidatus Woesearchaeota archaeon]|nr:hypothetical protein [Candidatus Woesearchaeota archaeon]
MAKKLDNVHEFVWKVIDTDISLKKDISRDLINIRKLAAFIIKTQKIDASIDSVISSIRRYKSSGIKKDEQKSAYEMLKRAKLSIRTKMISLELKRTDEIKTLLGRPDKLADYHAHDTVRILEGFNTLTIIFDKKNEANILSNFPKKNILHFNKNVGMLEISYPPELEKVPGVFFIIANEIAQNNISMIDALISSSEHILVVQDKDVVKAFDLIYNLIGQ